MSSVLPQRGWGLRGFRGRATALGAKRSVVANASASEVPPTRGSNLITRHLTLGRLTSPSRAMCLAPAAGDNYLWCMLRHSARRA